EKEDRRDELLAGAWKGLVNTRIRAIRDALEHELKVSRDTYQRALVSADLGEKVRKALDEGQCSSCGQDLSGAAKERLTTLIADAVPKEERAQLEGRIQQIEGRVAALRQSEAASNADVLQEVQDAIDDLKIKRATAEDRLAEI